MPLIRFFDGSKGSTISSNIIFNPAQQQQRPGALRGHFIAWQ